jgi:glycerol-3-phosphate acyltransferase PlsX
VTITVAVDMMSGDRGLQVTAPAVSQALGRMPDLFVIAVGEQTAMSAALDGLQYPDRLSFVAASEVVEMNEPAAMALRAKKDSSLRVSVNQVAEGAADACVSSGNTGALMATARFVLKTLSGIDRPAIVSALPRADGHVHVLDLGANVESSPQHLLQFGMMGSSLVRSLEGISEPTVALLNIGSEEIKGNNTVKAAAELFQDSPLNFVGYVEGDDIFNGQVDIIVCDGFAGNVALKTSEGLAQMLTRAVREEYSRGLWSRFVAVLSRSVLDSIRGRIDHRQYDGAVLLGLRGTVVKSHGGTDPVGFARAIEVAHSAVSHSLVENIRKDLGEPVARRKTA